MLMILNYIAQQDQMKLLNYLRVYNVNVKDWMTNNFLLLNSDYDNISDYSIMIILPQFYSLCTGYLLSSVSVTKYYYLPIRP